MERAVFMGSPELKRLNAEDTTFCHKEKADKY
jgi:hypothetical protein